MDYRADYIEVVFDPATSAYIDFFDTALAAAPGFKQCGWISMRHSLSSSALLSMHNFPSGRAVSLEFTTLKGLPGNNDWMRYLQDQALQHGGRPHWGQYNKLNENQVMAAYGANIMRWREALA